MKKLFLLTAIVCLVVPLAAQAQEKKEYNGDMPAMAPPAPLNDEWSNWLVGEWEGWTENAMGKSKDRLVIEKGLGDQFLMIQISSKLGEVDWTGMGCMTVDPKTGELRGYWIDSFRGMYEGTGKQEGDEETMTWKGTMGKAVRVTKKVSADKFVVSEKMSMPDGSVMEGKAEMTRVKKKKY